MAETSGIGGSSLGLKHSHNPQPGFALGVRTSASRRQLVGLTADQYGFLAWGVG